MGKGHLHACELQHNSDEQLIVLDEIQTMIGQCAARSLLTITRNLMAFKTEKNNR